MTLPVVSQEFWVATEPEMYFAPSGLGKCSFRVKAANQLKDDSTGKWKDGKTLWATAICWDKENMPLAQNVMESIKKGDDVVIIGQIHTRSYGDENERKFVVEIEVQKIGPSLTFRKTPHGAASSGGTGASSAPQGNGGTHTQPDTSSPAEAPVASGGSEEQYPF